VLAANAALIEPCSEIGHEILGRSARGAGAAEVIDRLEADLRREFSDMTDRPLAPESALHAGAGRSLAGTGRRRPASCATAVAQLAWGHNIALQTKLHETDEREWYAQQAIVQGWSRTVLEAQISTDLRGRQGKALSSVEHALPESESELVRDVMDC
jgi:hypothetical protein